MGTSAGPRTRRALAIATVSRSLALQSPEGWRVLSGRGYDLTFAAARDTWTDALVATGSSFEEIRAERSLRPGPLLQLAAGLRRLSREEWDLVQVQSPIISALWRVVATRRARGRTIYVVHGYHFQPGERGLRSRAVRLLEGALAHRTVALATVSAADHRFVVGLPRLLRPRVVVALPGAGVPVAAVIEPGPRPQEAPDGPYALFVGDLNANKDPLGAVEAVDECRRGGTDLDLVVIGEGGLGDDLRAAARTRPWLLLVDRTLEVPAWMAHAEVLLAPSRREGVPRVVLEALAVGTPVVARHNRGSDELLTDGLGELLPTMDPQAWAAAVRHVLADPPDEGAMQERARRYDVGPFRAAYTRLVARVEQQAGPPAT